MSKIFRNFSFVWSKIWVCTDTFFFELKCWIVLRRAILQQISCVIHCEQHKPRNIPAIIISNIRMDKEPKEIRLISGAILSESVLRTRRPNPRFNRESKALESILELTFDRLSPPPARSYSLIWIFLWRNLRGDCCQTPPPPHKTWTVISTPEWSFCERSSSIWQQNPEYTRE